MAFIYLFALDYIETWLRSHRCASDADPLQSKVFSETGRSSVKVLAGECLLYSNYLMQSYFLFGVEAAFTHLCVSRYTPGSPDNNLRIFSLVM